MTISVGTPSTDTDQNVSSVTFSHTVTAGKGRQLLVGVSFNNDGLEEITGVTYDGNALSLVVAHDRDDDSRCELWRLQDPPVGTANVVVTLDGTLTSDAGIVSGAVQLDEVDSVTPVGATASNDDDSALNTVTVSSNPGELVVDVAGVENETDLAAEPGQTELWNLDAGDDPKLEGGGCSHKAGASPDVDMEWTQGDDKWVSIAASFRPSVAPTVDAGGPYSGDVDTPIALNSTVTPGTDTTPALTWSIDSGGGGTFLPNANVADPTFTPDTVGPYTLRLNVVTVDSPDVFDTAALTSNAVAPTVDAGGPYVGNEGDPIALNATVTPGSDPAPVLLWTIDAGPGGGVFLPSAAVEDPTFTPDAVGAYTLRLTVTPSDIGPVFDTAGLTSNAVAPIVDAGGPYAGEVNTPIALNGTITPGTDPAPVLLWTIDAGPGGGVFLPSAAVEDPTFTPDTVGAYTLKLSADPDDGPPVEDTASLDSQAVPVGVTVNLGTYLLSSEGQVLGLQLTVGASPPPGQSVIVAGTAFDHQGKMYFAEDDGVVPRVWINGLPHQHNGVRLLSADAPEVNLAGFGFEQDAGAQAAIGTLPPSNHIKGIGVTELGALAGINVTPPPPAAPPVLPNLQHWFKWDDPLTTWQDTAGTIAAVLGQPVRRGDNHGYDPTPASDLLGFGAPNWQTDPVTGLNCLNSLASGDGISATNWCPNPSGAAGILTWEIKRVVAPGGIFSNIGMQWSNFGGPTTQWGNRVTVDGTPPWPYQATNGVGGFNNPGRNIVTTEWNWQWSGHDGVNAQSDCGGSSGGGSVANAYLQIPAGANTIQIGGVNGYLLESGCYDRMLTPAELTLLIAYMNGRVGGTMPF